MDTAFIIVWGIALLAIAVLLVTLVLALKRKPHLALPDADEPTEFDPVKDVLLFYYEEESVRSTAGGEVIVHIPGIAWGAEWREDLLRLEVTLVDPGSVAFPPGWDEAQILAAYTLCALRMTEMGTDIEVERFLEPIDVILTTDEADSGLRLVARTDNAWVLAPPAKTSLDELEGVDLPSGRSWIAASVTKLGQVCLIKSPSVDASVD